MKKIISCIAAMSCLLFALPTFAGNAAPLGLELGIATYAQVKQQIGGKTSLSDEGTNKYSGGKMLKGDGEGLGIDGLSKVLFIFDKSDKLAGVLMTLPKDSFRPTLKALSGKYKLEQKQEPFVGNASARLRQGDSVIELDAPHLSFVMRVVYWTNTLKQAFKQQSANEHAKKEKQQADML